MKVSSQNPTRFENIKSIAEAKMGSAIHNAQKAGKFLGRSVVDATKVGKGIFKFAIGIATLPIANAKNQKNLEEIDYL